MELIGDVIKEAKTYSADDWTVESMSAIVDRMVKCMKNSPFQPVQDEADLRDAALNILFANLPYAVDLDRED